MITEEIKQENQNIQEIKQENQKPNQENVQENVQIIIDSTKMITEEIKQENQNIQEIKQENQKPNQENVQENQMITETNNQLNIEKEINPNQMNIEQKPNTEKSKNTPQEEMVSQRRKLLKKGIYLMSKNKAIVYGIRFSPQTGKYLATCAENGEVVIYHVKREVDIDQWPTFIILHGKQESKKKLLSHEKSIQDIAWDPKGKYLFTQDTACVRVWDTSNWECYHIIKSVSQSSFEFSIYNKMR
ncbi:wd repeat protein [Anaeramoeba ignava]|uniref:Wd repeat protein n=1 Tax=Anaeramoeba ignava TaxID=1746090 RepID=A0A9Q0LE39_ANAIG|nr:wd repeat protein [Anaeramoeba ignava]